MLIPKGAAIRLLAHLIAMLVVVNSEHALPCEKATERMSCRDLTQDSLMSELMGGPCVVAYFARNCGRGVFAAWQLCESSAQVLLLVAMLHLCCSAAEAI